MTSTEIPFKKITVYLNENEHHYDGFRRRHLLSQNVANFVEAISYNRLDEGDSDEALLAEAFESFNIGTDLIAMKYRLGGHRSLSVGDLVVIDDTIYACERFGWSALPEMWGAYRDRLAKYATK